MSKLFGRKKEEEEVAPGNRGLSGEWEILDHPDTIKSSPEVARKPPRVASKPKPSAGDPAATGEEPNTSPRKMPGMVATVPIGELANVLKGLKTKVNPPPSNPPQYILLLFNVHVQVALFLRIECEVFQKLTSFITF